MTKKQKYTTVFLFILVTALTLLYCFDLKNRNVNNSNDPSTAAIPPGETYDMQPGTLISDWSHTYHIVAHALGGVDGRAYTNCLEAFYANYEQGTRLFEIDLDVTADGDLILTHTWEDFRNTLTDLGGSDPLSTEEFIQTKIYDHYSTVTFNQFLDLMETYPDFHVILDSKSFTTESTRSIYDQMLDLINAKNPELVHRFIPQAYNEEMIQILQDEYDFDSIIFTLYAVYYNSNPEDLFNIIRDYQIPVVVCHMDNDWAVKVITDIYAYAGYQEIQDNFQIYIHTINDYERVRQITEDYHFFGVYSDFITEKQYEEYISGKKQLSSQKING